MVRAFAMLLLLPVVIGLDLDGFASTKLRPRFLEQLTDSGTFGVQTYEYGDEIASEVGWYAYACRRWHHDDAGKD